MDSTVTALLRIPFFWGQFVLKFAGLNSGASRWVRYYCYLYPQNVVAGIDCVASEGESSLG